ncbi:MAG: DUF4249 family protein [Porphyromonadaceae bacterium]|nr:MAG: DUF4249 family protein [Porphyromonadaceae bacterium]
MRYSLITAFACILVFSGCETEIDVVIPADPTPVVYCILDQDSPVQYLRLSRSYLTDNASIPPDEPDSILFARATKVAVEEVIDGKVTKRAFFTPVDIAKDSGYFPRQEHWVYRADFIVKPETDYRLIIYIDEYDQIAYSSCYTVGNFEIINPLYSEVRYIHMLPDHNLSFYWTKSLNAAIYQLGFVMHYLEMKEDQTLEKEILIPLKSIFYLQATDNLFSYPINSTNFYNYLAETLPIDPTVLRKCMTIDAVIISGGEELGYYMRIQEAGQAFNLMDYTNIKNGIGIFSSKVLRRINGFSLTEQSIDTLAYGHATRQLNFVDRTGTRDGR